VSSKVSAELCITQCSVGQEWTSLSN